ncbi:UNVERIFIED_CONTAM: hypothetical protein K2H54_019459 [Gekko kuhli]
MYMGVGDKPCPYIAMEAIAIILLFNRTYKEKKRNDKNNLIRSGTSFIIKFSQLLEETNAPDAIQRKYMPKVTFLYRPQPLPLQHCLLYLVDNFWMEKENNI